MSEPDVAPAVLTEQELAHVAEALSAAGEDVAGPLTLTLLTGGRSNLTARIDDGATAWVLRMPPRAGRTPSAHDVVREYRIATGLHGTGVPVARPVLSHEDEEALGAPYVVFGFVEGRTVRSRDDLAALSDAEVDGAVTAMLGVLADLHRVDHEAVLPGFGRPGHYAERQLRRWSGQWERVGVPELDAQAQDVVRRLAARLPRQQSTSLVHGDYRIDNVLLGGLPGAPHVAAVVDWELSTTGDPVADVAVMCAYRDAGLDLVLGEDAAWASERLPTVDALAERYAGAGGVELADWDQHLALAYYKIGVIAAGIEFRRRQGVDPDGRSASAGLSVPGYLDLAAAALDRVR